MEGLLARFKSISLRLQTSHIELRLRNLWCIQTPAAVASQGHSCWRLKSRLERRAARCSRSIPQARLPRNSIYHSDMFWLVLSRVSLAALTLPNSNTPLFCTRHFEFRISNFG